MLTLTETAGAYLVELLGESEAPDDVAIRFVVEEQSLALRLDNHRPGDDSFDHEGKVVLLLDEQMSTMLAGKTLDVESSGGGPKLVLR